jgi:NAD(P)-dependent dehydrogenase (short-subunit alcohol dehydrogenase family)
MATVLVTGATDGIGRQTAIDLVGRGADVAIHGRDPKKVDAVASELERLRPGSVRARLVRDLASLAEVRALAVDAERALGALDVLLENAGVFMKRRELTVDGFEKTFAVNHLAHVLLAHLLLPSLERTKAPRIIVVSSMAHRSGRLEWRDFSLAKQYEGYAAYAQSKLANVLFATELARRLGDRARVHSLHPGVVSTNLLREGFGFGGSDSLVDGAATSVFLALDPEGGRSTGSYWVRKREAEPHEDATDRKTTARFYEESCRMVGIEPLPPV